MPYPYALESFATHESRYMGVKPTTENGIPAIAIKAVNEAHPGIFRMVKKRCLNRCEFPESWNLPFPLVLLPKNGKPHGVATPRRSDQIACWTPLVSCWRESYYRS